MLLTSGQISMTISSCVVFIFTSLLFLSGYVLQQQTVRGLQIALHPILPPRPNATATTQARIFGHPPGSSGHSSYQAYLGGNLSSVDWKRVAYVQIVRDHLHVCNAAMQFAELARQKSKAQRVLLYPRKWHVEDEEGKRDHILEISMRLLRVAASRYGVVVSAIDPILEVAQDALETAYPLSGLLSLTSFTKILYLRPSGLVLDSTPLDALFAIETNSSLTAFADTTDYFPLVTLMKPSDQAFDSAIAAIKLKPTSETFHLYNMTRFLPSAPSQIPLTARTSSLRLEEADFDSEGFVSELGYVQLMDPDILGPEYDIPRNVFLESRPVESEARRAWEDLYETYRMRRMDVCGLDLEPEPVLNSRESMEGVESKVSAVEGVPEEDFVFLGPVAVGTDDDRAEQRTIQKMQENGLDNNM